MMRFSLCFSALLLNFPALCTANHIFIETDKTYTITEADVVDTNKITVLGGPGGETIRVPVRANILLDANVDRLELPLAHSEYRFLVTGTKTEILGVDGTTAGWFGLNGPVKVAFADGSAELRLTGLDRAILAGKFLPADAPAALTLVLDEADASSIGLSQKEVCESRRLAATDINARLTSTVIVEVGKQAVGLPEGFSYQTIINYAAGSCGHTAFQAVAYNAETEEEIIGVWVGTKEGLTLIIKTNDTIPGLPSNVLFRRATPHLQVTSSGYVGFVAKVINDTQTLLAYVNGNLSVVLKDRDLAPGYTSETFTHNIEFDFSDAGMIIKTDVLQALPPPFTGARGFFGVSNLIYWDLNQLSLLAVSNKELNPLGEPQELLEFPPEGCDFGFFQSLNKGVTQINDAGDIVMNFSSEKVVDKAECPIQTLLKYSNGSLVMIADTPNSGIGFVPETPGLFPSTPWGVLEYALTLHNSGSISYCLFNKLPDDTQCWFSDENDQQKLAVLFGEKIPGDFTARMSTPVAVTNGNGYSVVEAVGLSGVAKQYVLAGEVRKSNPYNNVLEADRSQLDLIAYSGMIPPGLASTDLFDAMRVRLLAPNDDILFEASVVSATDEGAQHGIWLVKRGEAPKLFIENNRVLHPSNSDREVYFRTNGYLLFLNSGYILYDETHTERGRTNLTKSLVLISYK